jgi:hypothetical protein
LGPTFDPTFICTAYPFGIPEEVLSGEDAHLSSRGDDDGYIYTPNGVQLKHLPGKHNQKLHDPYKDRSAATGSVDNLVDPKTVNAEYELMQDIDAAVQDVKMGATSTHTTTNELFGRVGYNEKPDVVSPDKLDELIKDGSTELFRVEAGANAQKYADQFREGERHVGSGFYANGTHVAYGENSRGHALHFVKQSPEGGVMMNMALDKSAKVVTETDLKKAQADFATKTNAMNEKLANNIIDVYSTGDKSAIKSAIDASTTYATRASALQQYYNQDLSRLAVALGYDAIQGIDGTGGPETIILNRGKVHVSSADEVVDKTTKHQPGRHDQQRHAGSRVGYAVTSPEEAEWTRNLTKDELTAVNGYMNIGPAWMGSASINAALRTDALSADEQRQVELLDSAIAKAPKVTTEAAFYRSLPPGVKIADGAFISAFKNQPDTPVYASKGRILRKFTVSVGTPVAPVSALHTPFSEEVLLPRDVKIVSEELVGD